MQSPIIDVDPWRVATVTSTFMVRHPSLQLVGAAPHRGAAT